MKSFNNIHFKGNFRDYQQRVLDNADKYLKDGKINIVAAPGSGKTVLGLELIRRLASPCIVLSPTTAIRQQWGERFKDLFLDDEEDFSLLFSNDLHHIKLVNSITYQALYTAVDKISATEDEDILFEPGAIFYTEGFKVENKGDVPVNFRISVSKDESIDMEAFDEAVELWIVRKGDDFSSAQNLPEFEVKGLPAYTSSDTYFLFIKMKETAGNQFQKQSYSGIGITVYAVQGNVEIE